jgi:diguanylate cyclase (GGDEF)-like protein
LDFQLSPDQLRRSSYARQWASGFSNLRFDRRLESEFRAQYAVDMLRRRRLAILLGIGLFILFAAVDAVRLEGPAETFSLVIRLAVGLPLLAITLWISHSEQVAKLLAPMLMVVVCFVGLAISAIFFVAHGHGQAYQPEGLYMISVFIFFLTGLLFWRAVACAAIVLMGFITGPLWVGEPVTQTGFYAFNIFVLNLLCAFGCYLLEQRARETFLIRNILAQAADQDGLTGIANRRAFDRVFEDRVARAMTSRRFLAMLLLDLDHFKAYNDRYGHMEGDRVLRQVSEVLEDFARRPHDIAARLGGEEFAVLLYDTSAEAAEHQAEGLRLAVRDLGIPHTLNPPARVMTTSIGVAVLDPEEGGSTVSLLAAADQALYAAKDAGRDCVRFAKQSDLTHEPS